MLDDKTAAEIATILSNLIFGTPTGALSLLDECTSKWASTHPELAEVQREFSQARHGWWPDDPRRNRPENYSRLLSAAVTLADQLAVYGGEQLTLCGRPSVYSIHGCRGVKLADGCTYGEDSHTDKEQNA